MTNFRYIETALSRNLIYYRNKLGWSQDTLSEKSKVNISTIKKIERGETKKPNSTTFSRLCEALGIEAEQLIVENIRRNYHFLYISGVEARFKEKYGPSINSSLQLGQFQTKRFLYI